MFGESGSSAESGDTSPLLGVAEDAVEEAFEGFTGIACGGAELGEFVGFRFGLVGPCEGEAVIDHAGFVVPFAGFTEAHVADPYAVGVGAGDEPVLGKPGEGFDFTGFFEASDGFVMFWEGGPADGLGGWFENGFVADQEFVFEFGHGSPEEDIEWGGCFHAADRIDVTAGEVGIEVGGEEEFEGDGERGVGAAEAEAPIAEAGAFFCVFFGAQEGEPDECDEHREGEERIDDEEVVEAGAVVGKGPEDVGAIDGEDVDEDVGGPDEEEEGSGALWGDFFVFPEA